MLPQGLSTLGVFMYGVAVFDDWHIAKQIHLHVGKIQLEVSSSANLMDTPGNLDLRSTVR